MASGGWAGGQVETSGTHGKQKRSYIEIDSMFTFSWDLIFKQL